MFYAKLDLENCKIGKTGNKKIIGFLALNSVAILGLGGGGDESNHRQFFF